MTSLIILFKTLSFLLSVITTLIVPSLFNDPPMTLSPSFLYIGRDSPVKSDSSTLVSPLSISPSRGIVSPGLTKITSFCFKNFVSILSRLPFLQSVASFGLNFKSSLIVLFAFLFEKFSINFPKDTKTRIIEALSR